VIGTLLVVAKQPLPGKVKTRLVPPLTYHEAAELAEAALGDTLRVAASVATRRVLVLDGAPGPWLAPGWQLVPQVGRGLDERLAAAFAGAGRGATVLVGMDTPQLHPRQLAAFDPSRYDACLDPAVDGGYWAIGFAEPAAADAAIRGVPMSTVHTGAHQLRALGLRVQRLDTLEDVAPVAVTFTRQRGAIALRRNVFAHVPGKGRWPTALLIDGNIGISGDVVRLLRRMASLLAHGGRLLVEADPQG
jgi:uncharacterized protein